MLLTAYVCRGAGVGSFVFRGLGIWTEPKHETRKRNRNVVSESQYLAKYADTARY